MAKQTSTQNSDEWLNEVLTSFYEEVKTGTDPNPIANYAKAHNNAKSKILAHIQAEKEKAELAGRIDELEKITSHPQYVVQTHSYTDESELFIAEIPRNVIESRLKQLNQKAKEDYA